MRKIIIAIVCLGVLIGGGYGGIKGYKSWKQKRLVKLAREFIEKGDSKNAVLCLRSALGRDPRNIEACSMMAAFAEMAASRDNEAMKSAIMWRQKLVDLQPDSFTNRLALAKVASAGREIELAKKTLDSISEANKKTAIFHTVAAAVAIASTNYSDAEVHFAEASRLEPTNILSQLNLRAIQLIKKDPQASALAQEAMKSLTTNKVVRYEALRQLTEYAIRHTNVNEALLYSSQVLGETNATFLDRMHYLEIMHAATNASERSFLASMQNESATNSAKAAELAKWIYAVNSPQVALDWLKSLPPATRTNLPAAQIEADYNVSLKNWNDMLKTLETQSWGNYEFLRLSYRAKAFKELGINTSASTEWSQAIKATEFSSESSLNNLNIMLFVASNWKWQKSQETEDVLWAIVNKYPQEKKYIQDLASLLYSNDKTKMLLKLFVQQAKNDPKDISTKNNVASIALLLNATEFKPHELALEVYETQKDNPYFAATYAYSLYLQKKNEQALEVMKKLKAEELSNPSISGYYGLILKSAGVNNDAKKYLDLAIKAPHRLPEEKDLFLRAASTN